MKIFQENSISDFSLTVLLFPPSLDALYKIIISPLMFQSILTLGNNNKKNGAPVVPVKLNIME